MFPSIRAEGEYYVALGIDPNVGTAQVNAAFRRLARRYHPDHNPAPDATLQFQYINEARQALTDPVRRAAYDARRTPKCNAHRRGSSEPIQPHSHRNLHRRHRVRPILLTLVAFFITVTACASLLAAVSYRHYSMSTYDLDTSLSSPEEEPHQSGLSPEMFRVCRIDDPCIQSMAWEIDLPNSWDGSSRALSAPIVQALGSGGVLDFPSRGYESRHAVSNDDQL
ncbi:MAG: J domain-containing protein [Candidatus Korobacteraceae bacterium]